MAVTPPSVVTLRQVVRGYLAVQPAWLREKGEDYFRRGTVTQLEVLDPAAVEALAQAGEEAEASGALDLFGEDFEEQDLGNPGSVVWIRAAVAGSRPRPYVVALKWDLSWKEGDSGRPWVGFCSCPVGLYCKHVQAATLAVEALARSNPEALGRDLERVALVLPKAGGQALAGSPKAGAASDVAAVGTVATARLGREVSLERQLEEHLGRHLMADELRYLATIERVFNEVRTRRVITGWHLESLGFVPPDGRWAEVKIWPSLPDDAVEMWGHLAHAATTWWRQEPPPFLKSWSETIPVDDGVRAWRRQRGIQAWKARIAAGSLEVTRSAPAEVDIRWVFGPDRAYPEVFESTAATGPVPGVELATAGSVAGEGAVVEPAMMPGAEPREPEPGESPQGLGYRELKSTVARAMHTRLAANECELSPGSEMLWTLIAERLASGFEPGVRYGDSTGDRLLLRILGSPVLRARLVNELGRPLRFHATPLRWRLREAATDDGDHVLCLALPDGASLPASRVAVEGRWLYLISAEAVHLALPLPRAFGGVNAEVPIPAPALETSEGVELLRALGVPLPARIQDRVRVVPVRLRVRCGIEENYLGRSGEQCCVRLLAESDDGEVRLQWRGTDWGDAPANRNEGGPRRKPGEAAKGGRGREGAADEPDAILSYDRSALASGPGLLSPLGLRWEYWTATGVARVTKKFPQEFADWCRSLPPEVELELSDELASLRADVVAGSVRLDVAEDGVDWFNLKVILDVSETDLSPAEIKLLLDARGGYVRLQGKGWRRLQFDLTDEEDERLSRLGLNARELTSEPQRLHVLQLADPSAKRFLGEAQFDRVQRRAGELKARVNPKVPDGLRAELRPYQRDGYHFLAYLSTNRFGGILADDMGLGKTVQTLAWMAWLRGLRGNGHKPVLVVCPKSVTDNWRAEAARFLPGLGVRVWAAGELGALAASVGTADLHVLNYSQLRAVSEALESVAWLAVVLDEGQYIKNPDSQTAHVARRLRAEHRLVLTGTPIENRLMDLWSLMSFAMPGALGSRAQFTRQFGGKDDLHARRRLAARVRPFLLRRTKSQVAKDLPDRIEEDLRCEMEGEQRTLYRAELKRAQQMLLRLQTAKQLAEERFSVLTSLLRLRQICCDPRLVKPGSAAGSAKVEALLEQLEPLMEEGQKVLVFSQFVTMLDLLRDALAEKGWTTFYLAGDTENRGELVESFQTAEGGGVFLISLKAGGFGLNLTSAGYVVLFDPWWNPAVESQAIDRTHRIGQTQKVIAYRLLIKDSVEEKIRDLQKKKSALAEDVLGEEKFSQSLTLADLRFLLSD